MTNHPDTSQSGEILRSVVSGGSSTAKRHYWNEMIAQAIAPTDFRTPDWEKFSASMHSRLLGGADMTLIKTSPGQSSTTSEMLSRRRVGRISLTVCLKGEMFYDQEGSSTVFRAGQAAVVHSLRLHRLRADAPVELLMLTLDQADIVGQAASEGPAIVLSPTEPIAAVTLDLVRKSWNLLPQISPDQKHRLQTNLGKLVSESLATHVEGPEQSSCHMLATIYRAKAIVMRRFAEIDFGPQELADSMGITKRYLAKLFEANGEAPADYIRQVRLFAAWEFLTDARCDLPISEIGFRVGLSDSSMFAKAVKSKFSMSPRDIRRNQFQ